MISAMCRSGSSMPKRIASKDARKGFASWLTRTRKQRGLTMRSLGEAAEVSHVHISNIEHGGPFSRDMVERLARALSPLGAGEDEVRTLTNAGLKAAGFTPPSGGPETHSATLELLTSEQKHRLWESMGARTYYGPQPDDNDFELSENPDEWPPDLREALQEALFYTRLIPPEFVRTVFQLWRDQARAHAGVAVNNKVMDAAMKENKASKG